MRKEEELISILSQVEVEEQRLTWVECLLKNNLDWDYILNRSKEESVYPFIYYHLNNFPYKDYIPKDILERFKTAYYNNSLTNLRLYEEAKRVFKIFNEENIKPIVLKGIFLAENIYKNIALRPMTDVDILIKKEDFLKVNEILNSLGYSAGIDGREVLRRPFSYSLTFSPSNPKEANSFSIDVHWHILSSTWLMGFLLDKVDMERIWVQAEPIKIGNADAFTLSPALLLIFLSLHGFSHNFERIILLTDILEAIIYYQDRLEWDRVRKEAERMEVENILSYALYFTFQKLGYEPHKIQEFNLSKDSFGTKIIKFFINFINNRKSNFYGLPCLIYILTKDKLKDRLRLMVRTVSLLNYLISRRFKSLASTYVKNLE